MLRLSSLWLFYWQSLLKYLVSVANDNVNNDVIVLLLFSSRQIYLTHWGTWYTYARTLPPGGGGIWYFHRYVGSGEIFLGAWNSWYFWGWKLDARREPTHAENNRDPPPPPPEHSGFAEIRRLKKANMCEIKIMNMSPWRPWTPKITTLRSKTKMTKWQSYHRIPHP